MFGSQPKGRGFKSRPVHRSLSERFRKLLISKCGYPLTPSAFDEFKMEEDKKFTSLNEKYENDMKELREQMKLSDQKHDQQLGKIISLIQENSRACQS